MKNSLRMYRVGANEMLLSIRASLEARVDGQSDTDADIETMKLVDQVVVRECEKLIELLRRISNDVAQTILEDPIEAAKGWVLLSKPVLEDLQKTLHEFVPEHLAKKYRGHLRT